ncbi:MAG: class I SAM-dependent methyltransferase [Candidatus Heimdallarchaeota archaeon]
MKDSEFYRIVLQKLGHVSKVLDIGCGEGKLVTFLAMSTKKNVVGVDISEAGFKTAKKKATIAGIPHLIACMRCDAHQIGECVGSERFEVVTMSYTLHHLKEPTIALREIRKIIAPKGRILIIDCILDGVNEPGECHKFTLRGIQRMLKEAGYRFLTTEELEPDIALFEAEA